MNMNIPNYLEIFAKQDGSFYLKERTIVKKLLEQARKVHSTKELCTKLSISSRIFYYYLRCERAPPLRTILQLIDLTGRFEMKEELYKAFSAMYTWGHGTTVLPKEYTEDLAHLTGVICGDGHISKRTEVQIANESEEYLKRIVLPTIHKLFNVTPPIFEEKRYFTIYMGSRPANVFFSDVVGIPKGKKKGKLRVPKFVYLNKRFKIKFIQGLFDTDGGFTCSKRNKKSILISSSTYPFIIEVQKLLLELGVRLPGPYRSGNRKGYEIRSFVLDELLSFKNNIGFVHPDKKKRFHALVAQR